MFMRGFPAFMHGLDKALRWLDARWETAIAPSLKIIAEKKKKKKEERHGLPEK